MLTHATLDADEMRGVVAEIEAALPAHAWPCWAGSNHDIGRLATRWAEGDEARARCALLILLGLRGTPCLYYGDELALEAGDVPHERVLDVADALARSGQDADAVDAPRAAGATRGCRSSTRAATSRSSAPTRARRSTSRAT